MSAAAHLRALVAALPEGDRVPWHDGGKHGIVDENGDSIVVMGMAPYVFAPHRAIIATAADPTVVTALADLLEALAEPVRLTSVGVGSVDHVIAARDAVEAAILRGSAT